MIIDFADKRANYMLDSKKEFAPFPNGSRPVELTALPQFNPGIAMRVVVSAATDDHPWDKMSLTFPNYLTKRDNHLIRVQRTIDLYTAFVARDKSVRGPFSILAYVTWHAVWDFDLTYHLNAQGPPQVTALKAIFTVDPFVKGAPADPNVAHQITAASPGDKMYNDTASDEILHVIKATADTSLVKAFKHWDPVVNPAPHFIP